MLVHAQYTTDNSAVKLLFWKFLNKLPAINIMETEFDVDLNVAQLKIGELLHILHSMIDIRTDSITVDYEIMEIKMRSHIGKPRNSK